MDIQYCMSLMMCSYREPSYMTFPCIKYMPSKDALIAFYMSLQDTLIFVLIVLEHSTVSWVGTCSNCFYGPAAFAQLMSDWNVSGT